MTLRLVPTCSSLVPVVAPTDYGGGRMPMHTPRHRASSSEHSSSFWLSCPLHPRMHARRPLSRGHPRLHAIATFFSLNPQSLASDLHACTQRPSIGSTQLSGGQLSRTTRQASLACSRAVPASALHRTRASLQMKAPGQSGSNSQSARQVSRSRSHWASEAFLAALAEWPQALWIWLQVLPHV